MFLSSIYSTVYHYSNMGTTVLFPLTMFQLLIMTLSRFQRCNSVVCRVSIPRRLQTNCLSQTLSVDSVPSSSSTSKCCQNHYIVNPAFAVRFLRVKFNFSTLQFPTRRRYWNSRCQCSFIYK